MKLSRRHFAVVKFALALICSVPFVAQSWAEEKPLTPVSFALTDGGFALIQLWIADGAGYFKEEGLAVDLVNLQTGGRTSAAIASGSALMGPLSLSHVYDSSANGGPFVAVGQAFGTWPYSIVLTKQAAEKLGIQSTMSLEESLKLLKGVKIGYTGPGSSTDQFIQGTLRGRGIDPSALQLVPLAPGAGMVAAMEAGSVDGFVWLSPFTDQVTGSGLAVTIANGNEIPEFSHFPFVVWTTTKSNLKDQEPRLKAALRALAKADRLAADDPARARSFVRARFPNMDDATFDDAYKQFVVGVPARLRIDEEQHATALRIQNIVRGDKKIDVKFTDVIDTSITSEVDKELGVVK